MNPDIVTFFSSKKEYRSLSNFWENEILIQDERIYESGEHCFHGEKYIRLGKQCEKEDRKKVLLEYGLTFCKPSSYKTGAMAKKMGGKKGLLLSSEELLLWDTMRLGVQEEICIYKFKTDEIVRQDLLKSGNKTLIHPALRCSEEKVKKNSFWEGRAVVKEGTLVILGQNMLGNIWMSLRK
jgi:predicted NAD-dependent protein-ADP-ribosyltransferase YbiA (DUF1768 family)